MYLPSSPLRFRLLRCRPFSFVISLQLLCVRLMHSSGITAGDEGHIEWVKRLSVTNNAHILSPSTTLQSDGGVWFTQERFCLHNVLHICIYLQIKTRNVYLELYSTAFRRQWNISSIWRIWFVDVYWQMFGVDFFTLLLAMIKT